MIPVKGCINKCISTKYFPDELKEADVTPLFKKEDPNNKANFRPISFLPIISKVFGRFFSRLKSLSKKTYHQNYVVLENTILHNMFS